MGSMPEKLNGPSTSKLPGQNYGAWVPWEIAERLPRLRLGPSSRWQVFQAVLMTWYRYGQDEARLGIKEIAAVTGLCTRTVKAALKDLLRSGLLRRRGRYKRLVVDLDVLRNSTSSAACLTGANVTMSQDERGADIPAPPKGTQACTSPTSSYVLEKDSKGGAVFSKKQTAVIQDVLEEASELLGSDAAALPIPTNFTGPLGLPEGTTYGMALHQIRANGTPHGAGKFTAAVLALRHDQRVQGEELLDGDQPRPQSRMSCPEP